MIIRSALAAFSTVLLAACLGGGGMSPGFVAPPPPPVAAMQTAGSGANPGAIYQAAQGYSGLHVGTRARRLGDMVSIVLVENTSTNKSTSSQTQRDGSFSITPPTTGPLAFLNPNALNAGAQGSFTGQGNASQQSQLSGTVSVTIAALYPNGTAEVVGEKQMSLSQGVEWIQFAGRIRLIDIDADNRLSSAQVANARIIYSGDGSVQRASQPGWLSRFFSLITPF
ncbi:MAG: flagellar basal body L-ring protein FlgH [Erythrobacter sp.]